jgi:ParB family chromosome partitioning protein
MAKQPKSLTTRNRLGRGLSSLISSSSPPPEPAFEPELAARAPIASQPAEAAASGPSRRGPAEIRVGDIAANPHQPRRHFDPTALAELAASIRQQGVLQPLLVARATHEGAERPYVLIAGERRLRAAREAGLDRVPCVLREATDRQMLEWSLIENIQRADLNAVERGRAYRDYIDRFGLTQAEVAERTGEARATIANYLRILDLSDDVQQMLLGGALTFGHARALAGLAGRPRQQEKLAARIVDRGLSVRQAERLVSAQQGDDDDRTVEPTVRPRKAPYVLDLEARLARAVGTRVTVLPGRAKNSGRIVLDYYSLDDFDRIAALLGLKEDE